LDYTLRTEGEPDMPLAEDKVREALKQVIDPELFVNIVDLGLIYVVAVGEEKEDSRHDVNVEMTLTSPMCPAGPQLVGGAKSAVEGLDKVDICEVKVVMEPAWSPDNMTDEARDHLGIF
jgi:metal-sulfur cluster biosynthetic enzyme